MYFDDGSNPSTQILKSFIATADPIIASGGRIAVHCKAGLGRTGVLIGAYLIWKYSFTPSEIIGFMRFMRPGCVVGPQQHFMYENGAEWIRWNQEEKTKKRVREEMKKELEVEKKEMKKQFSKELEEEKKKVRNSNEVEVEGKKGIKRRSEEESQEAEESESQASRITPSTPPSAKRFAAESSDTTTPLANNVPTYKPTPIVGQPRKSPSPERKRPASSNKVPKTVARMQYSTSSSRNGGGFGRTPSGNFIDGLNTNGSIAELNESSTLTTSPSKVLGSSKTNLLMAKDGSLVNEVETSLDDTNTLSKPTSTLVTNSQIRDEGNTTPTPSTTVHRVRGTGHERTRSEIIPSNLRHSSSHPQMMVENDVFNSENSSLTPKGKGGSLPPIRASPDIKNKYGLKDASSSPNTSGIKKSDSNQSMQTSSSTSSTNVVPNSTSEKKIKEEKKKNGLEEKMKMDLDAEALGIVEFSNAKDVDSSFEDQQKSKKEIDISSPRKPSVSSKRIPSSSTDASTTAKKLINPSASSSSSRSISNSDPKSKANASTQPSSKASSNSSKNPASTAGSLTSTSTQPSSKSSTSTATASSLKRRPLPSTTTSSLTSNARSVSNELRNARAGLTRASSTTGTSSRIRSIDSKTRVGIPPANNETTLISSTGLAASARARPISNPASMSSNERPTSPNRIGTGVGRGTGTGVGGSNRNLINPVSSTSTSGSATAARANLKRARMETTPELRANGFICDDAGRVKESNVARFNASSNSRIGATNLHPPSMGMGLNRSNAGYRSEKEGNKITGMTRNVRRRRSSMGEVDVPL